MLAEVDRLRARLLPAPVAPPPPRGPAGAAFVGRVVSTSNGLAAGKFVKVNPVLVTGAESEGGAATETVNTGVSQLVYLLRGTAATNDDLICYRVPYRWVATKKAAAVATCIPCKPPLTSLTGTKWAYPSGHPAVSATFTLTYSATNPDSVVLFPSSAGTWGPDFWWASCVPVPVLDGFGTGTVTNYAKVGLACLTFSGTTFLNLVTVPYATDSTCAGTTGLNITRYNTAGGPSGGTNFMCVVGTCASFFHVTCLAFTTSACPQTNPGWEVSQ